MQRSNAAIVVNMMFESNAAGLEVSLQEPLKDACDDGRRRREKIRGGVLPFFLHECVTQDHLNR